MTKGYVTSPGYPNQYPVSQSCHMTLDPGPYKYLRIKFYDVYITPNVSGCVDYLSIHANNTVNDVYCGYMDITQLPEEFEVDALNVSFHSDDMATNDRGFMFSYEGMSGAELICFDVC
jgi:hypothetical protein